MNMMNVTFYYYNHQPTTGAVTNFRVAQVKLLHLKAALDHLTNQIGYATKCDQAE